MSEQRLHPAAIIFQLIRILKEAIFAIGIGLITFRGESFIYFIITAVSIILLLTIFCFLSWYRYTYRVEENELRIEYGVLIRKKRFVSTNRIQSIDLTSSVIHRILGLVKVEIQTASSGAGAEASLSAVKLIKGEHLRSELKPATITNIEMDEDENEINNPTLTIPFKRLFLAGSTSGSIGVIAAIALFAFSELEQFIPTEFYDNTLEWIIGLSIVLIIGFIVLILTTLWIFGIAGTMIKYGNFTITKNDDELFITRGLLEKKQLTIPLKRIQAVGIKESILRQPLGYVTVFVELAGDSSGNADDISVLFPIMKIDEVEGFLQSFLPNYAITQKGLTPLPKRARKFYLLRSIIPIIVLAGAVGYYFPQFSWLLIILLFVSLYLGVLRHKDGGYTIEGEQLTIRYRMFSKITMIIYKRRIQAFEKKQHKIQEMEKLSTMRLSITGSLGTGTHYLIKDLGTQDVDQMVDWYSDRT